MTAGILDGLQQAPFGEAGVAGSYIFVAGLSHQHANLADEAAQLPAHHSRSVRIYSGIEVATGGFGV